MMHWASLSDFLHMGGYALYVWGSYGMFFVLVLAEIILLRRSHKQLIKRLKRMRNWEDE